MYDEVFPGAGGRDSILNTGALRVRPVVGRALAASTQLVNMGGRLRGWAVRETTGSNGCVIELYDGNSSAGQLVVPVGVGNGASGSVWFGDDGVDIESGVYVNVVFGTADVVVYFQFDTGRY